MDTRVRRQVERGKPYTLWSSIVDEPAQVTAYKIPEKWQTRLRDGGTTDYWWVPEWNVCTQTGEKLHPTEIDALDAAIGRLAAKRAELGERIADLRERRDAAATERHEWRQRVRLRRETEGATPHGR